MRVADRLRLRIGSLLRDLQQDLRFGARVLARTPAFTAIAVLTLALGVGATTSIFSVVDGVLLKPLPYTDPGRLVTLMTRWNSDGHDTPRLSGGNLLDLRSGVDVFDEVSVFVGDEIAVRAGRSSELTGTWFVNTSFFRVLGVQPVAGRAFHAEDVERAAVVTAGYAGRQFGSARAAIGRLLSIDTRTYEIVGVIPDALGFPRLAEIWVPVPDRPDNVNRTAHNYPTIARVRADRPASAVDAALATLSRRLAEAYPDSNGRKTIVAVPLHERLVGSMRSTMYLLLGAVLLLFLIACVNVGNLLLARASIRSRELALRAALGASRQRIVRQLVVESVLLAAVGGVAGLALAYAGTGALIRLAPSDLPRLDAVHVDATVLAFGCVASLAASLLFGLAPAWQASRVNVRERMAGSGARGAVGGGSSRLRTALAVTEIGLAVVLAIGAALLFRSFIALSSVELGYDTSDVIVIQANLPTGDGADEGSRAIARYERLFPTLAEVPGVEAVSAAVGLPMGRLGSNGYFAVEGRHVFASGQNLPSAIFRLTSPGYFAAMRIPLRRGRDFTSDDIVGRERVAIVSERLAREVFPGTDPIGHRVQCGLDPESLNFMSIVGIVGDVRDEPGVDPVPEIYMPLAQHPSRGSLVQLVVRAGVPPESLAGVLDARIRSADPEIATKVEMFGHVARDAVAAPRFRTWLVATFAGLALMLALGGVYGLLSYVTAQRTPELGVRMALGASPVSLVRLVLARAVAIGAAGAAIGFGLSVAASRSMATLVFGVAAVDVETYVAVVAAVLAATLAAAAVPAWRATRIDPVSAIRGE